MAAAGGPLSPVQIQKLLFLVDRRLAAAVGGPHFQFEPYDYGPFDATVYHSLEGLEDMGLAEISRPEAKSSRTYGLSPEGQAAGERELAALGDTAARIRELAAYVASLTFAQLVSAIYREYPEMRVNSVFHR